MIHLVYVSSATQDMDQADLVRLLEQSRTRNKRQDVTGMLLYAGGNFFQVLEGDERDVREIYADITKDERNAGNIILLEEPITERTFPEWSMGFKYLDADAATELEGYADFLEGSVDTQILSENPNQVLRLLHQFKENNL